jgi:hypothetical protein
MLSYLVVSFALIAVFMSSLSFASNGGAAWVDDKRRLLGVIWRKHEAQGGDRKSRRERRAGVDILVILMTTVCLEM